MRRNNYKSTQVSGVRLLVSGLVCLMMAAFFFQSSFAQTKETGLPYTVISSNEHEVIISIHPDYQIRTITDEKTGESYEQITFRGGSVKDIPVGAPATQWLPIQLLTPSKEPVAVQILKE